jgi:hypothetical protein
MKPKAMEMMRQHHQAMNKLFFITMIRKFQVHINIKGWSEITETQSP